MTLNEFGRQHLNSATSNRHLVTVASYHKQFVNLNHPYQYLKMFCKFLFHMLQKLPSYRGWQGPIHTDDLADLLELFAYNIQFKLMGYYRGPAPAKETLLLLHQNSNFELVGAQNIMDKRHKKKRIRRRNLRSAWLTTPSGGEVSSNDIVARRVSTSESESSDQLNQSSSSLENVFQDLGTSIASDQGQGEPLPTSPGVQSEPASSSVQQPIGSRVRQPTGPNPYPITPDIQSSGYGFPVLQSVGFLGLPSNEASGGAQSVSPQTDQGMNLLPSIFSMDL